MLEEAEGKITSLLENAATLEGEEIEAAKAALEQDISEMGVPKQEKKNLLKLLKPLRDVILDKREQALLSLSEDDQQALQHLRDLAKEKKQIRLEIKQQLEKCRKEKGTSGFDFERAMQFEEQMAELKVSLAKSDESLSETEAKIRELEAKVS